MSKAIDINYMTRTTNALPITISEFTFNRPPIISCFYFIYIYVDIHDCLLVLSFVLFLRSYAQNNMFECNRIDTHK